MGFDTLSTAVGVNFNSIKKEASRVRRSKVGQHFNAPFEGGTFRDFSRRAGAASPLQQFVINPQQDAKQMQKESLAKQKQAQAQALGEANQAKRLAGEANRKANKKAPNIGALLAASLFPAASSTLLSNRSFLGGA